ncbi:MAG: sarcosine oxidase subunit gamma family protein [Casimicrobiaceae bacterium]
MADQNEFAIGAVMTGHYGVETTGVTLAETTFAAAWNVQGDARRPEFIDRVGELFTVSLPITPNTTARNAGRTALWLGPTSWLVIGSNLSHPADFESGRDALNAVGGALFDVSASRVAWTVAGTHAATILAKACPLDFHPRAFAEEACAQSVFGRVNALFYRRAAAPVFTLMVARSFARDAWRTLCLSAAAYGYEVLLARDF